MAWPGMAEYSAAVQNPRTSFLLPELKPARVATNALGLPRVSAGAFAVVYEVEESGQTWAIRCFTKDVGDLESRYAEIDRHLRTAGLPYFVSFTYAAKGILVNGKPYPLVKMEWVKGPQLADYVEQNLGQPDRLLALAARFGELSRSLEQNQIGHGDISADNVIVTAGGIKLIDYDGMYVPSLAGRRARELGNPTFQHPKRDETIFGPQLDRFSVLVVCAALAALAVDSTLWKRFGDGNGLLFTVSDLRDPDRSDLLRGLLGARDPVVASLAKELVNWLRANPARPGSLPDVSGLRVTPVLVHVPVTVPPAPPRPTIRPGTRPWWQEHEERATPPPPTPVPAPQPSPIRIKWGVVFTAAFWTGLVCFVFAGSTGGASFIAFPIIMVVVIMLARERPAVAISTAQPGQRSGAPTPYPTPSRPSPASQGSTAQVVASTIRRKYHRPSCRWARRISRQNRITHNSAADARAAGRYPCRECNP